MPVVITTPVGNAAPAPQLTRLCTGMSCAVSGAGTLDPNSGDVVSYSWNWGDGTSPSTGQTGSHAYLTPGTFTIQLTVTDGWGASATTSTQVTVPAP